MLLEAKNLSPGIIRNAVQPEQSEASSAGCWVKARLEKCRPWLACSCEAGIFCLPTNICEGMRQIVCIRKLDLDLRTCLTVIDGVSFQDIIQGSLARPLSLLVVHMAWVCAAQVPDNLHLLLCAFG